MYIKVYRDRPDVKLPTKAHREDAGFDIYAPEDFTLGDSKVIDTHIHIDIPVGYVGFLKSKSGLNVKCHIINEGVVDSGYTGPIIVKLTRNVPTTDQMIDFKKGDKLTQLVILPIPDVDLIEVASTEEFDVHNGRESGGLGSTGR